MKILLQVISRRESSTQTEIVLADANDLARNMTSELRLTIPKLDYGKQKEDGTFESFASQEFLWDRWTIGRIFELTEVAPVSESM